MPPKIKSSGPSTKSSLQDARVCSRSALPSHMENVSLDDPLSTASRLCESLTQAKIDELGEQGIKGLPLKVVQCAVRTFGTSRIPFQFVELQTNYDLSKLASVQADPPKRAVVDGSDTQLLFAMPVVLVPSNAKFRLVFTFVVRSCDPSAKGAVQKTPANAWNAWTLRNKRSEDVTVVSQSAKAGSATTLKASLVIRGGVEEALAKGIEESRVQKNDSSKDLDQQSPKAGASRRTAARAARRKAAKQKGKPSNNLELHSNEESSSDQHTSSGFADFGDELWLDKYLAGEFCGSREQCHFAEVEKLLAGWLSATRAAEACSQWEGTRVRWANGPQYWCYRRNENICWRLCFLKLKHASTVAALPLFMLPVHPVALGCAWGRCTEKLCTCRPNPWQPLPIIEPVIQPRCCNPLTPGSSVCPCPYHATIRKQSVGLALNEVTWTRLPPIGAEDEATWKHLLRGTHAFSLQASVPTSLYPEDHNEAICCAHRIKNAGWRRWWLAHKASTNDRARSSKSIPVENEASPASLFKPAAPAINQILAGAGQVVLPSSPSTSITTGKTNDHMDSAMAFVSVPLHLVGHVQRFAEQLQMMRLLEECPTDIYAR